MGYAIHDRVLARADLDAIADGLAGAEHHRSRAGMRHLMSVTVVRELAYDPRLMAIARGAVGPMAVPFRATLFDKSAHANWLIVWHQDSALPLVERRDVAGWGPWSVKAGVVYAHAPAVALERVVALRISLDDSGPDNGPLRVLPGTHTLGVLTDATIADLATQIRPVDCCVDAGGVVMMRPLTVHSSSKAVSDRPRRVLHLEYIDSLDVADGLQVAIT